MVNLVFTALFIFSAMMVRSANASICDRHPAIQRAIFAELQLENCGIVTNKMLETFRRLEVLNQIDHISETDLLGFRQLEKLILFRSQIKSISENAFNDLGSLKELNLSHNQIKTIPKNLFRPLVSIEVLRLRSNPIVDFPDGVFATNHHLRVLDISTTDLEGLPDGLFRTTPELKELDLFGSRGLARLKPSWFIGLTQLKVLELGRLGIRELPPELLEKIQSVELLSIDFNGFDESIFAHLAALPNLNRLEIRENRIRNYRKSDLKLLKSLKFILIGDSDLHHLEDNLFVGTSIERVDVDFSPLSKTNAAAFRGVVVNSLPKNFGISGDQEADTWD